MRAVLITIADAANRDGEHAHPGKEAMVEGSLYSRAMVTKIVRRLVDEGWVAIEEEGKGRGRATVYRVLMGRQEAATSEPLLDGKRLLSDQKAATPDPKAATRPTYETSPTVYTTEGLSTGKPGRSRSLPDDFEVDEAMRAWANEKAPAVNLSAETEKFKDHALANGKRYTDWRAAWRTWIGNARDWAKPARKGTDYQPEAASVSFVAGQLPEEFRPDYDIVDG